MRLSRLTVALIVLYLLVSAHALGYSAYVLTKQSRDMRWMLDHCTLTDK